MNYYSLNPPQKWKAGHTGTAPNEQPFYFNCADCGAKEPVIAGFAGSGPTFHEVALMPIEGSALVKTAMFCAPCFAKRLAENKPNAG
jgi:hypothetical protein